MNFFGLVGMVERIAGPGAFERALSTADDVVEALVESEDRLTGRAGRDVVRGATPLAVALHSVTPPRARFCRRRFCRSAS